MLRDGEVEETVVKRVLKRLDLRTDKRKKVYEEGKRRREGDGVEGIEGRCGGKEDGGKKDRC